LSGLLSFGQCPRPRVNQRGRQLVTIIIAGRYFVGWRSGFSRDTEYMHPVRSVPLQLYRSEVGNAIRSNIFFGISNLVQKLLFDRLLAYQSTGAFMLSDVKITIRFGFNNGESEIHKVINLFP